MGTKTSQRPFPPSSLRKRSTKLVILSVDDEASILITRQQILESQGYEVLSAADGRQALRLFAVRPVALVLLDYKMPGMDGATVAREMKQLKPAVPVIMVTASSLPDGVASGADGFIAKGDGPAQLLEKIAGLFPSMSPARTAQVRVQVSPHLIQKEHLA